MTRDEWIDEALRLLIAALALAILWVSAFCK